MKKGRLVIISGPSGVGKGTVCNEVTKINKRFILSVSATTRKKRDGEIDGKHYHFISKDDFIEKINSDEFIEWAQYIDNYYGTLKSCTQEKLDNGFNVILEIEVQGASNIKRKAEDAVSIFLVPPSMEELRSRLIKRGTETEEQINKRTIRAHEEMKYKNQYDHIVVNDVLSETVNRIIDIL